MVHKEIALRQRVLEFIRTHNLFPPGAKVLVAVSGGADSICLLHILFQLQKALDLELHVAHLNHMLRGNEADDDAWYVLDMAHRLNIPITIDTRDVTAYQEQKHCSLEEAAREVRYSFLAEVARKIAADCVAVGHTRNDQVETILMHILRGSGVAGLAGLQPKSAMRIGGNLLSITVVRPLLEVDRQETVSYCRLFKLKPRDDSSNKSLVFLRNRVRLELLPALRKYNQQIDAALLRLATIAADQLGYIEAQASTLWNEIASTEGSVIYLDKKKMLNLSVTMQRTLFRMAIEHISGNLKDIESDHIEKMLNLLSGSSGRSICLPRELKLSVEYERLALAFKETTSPPFPPLEQETCIAIPGETAVSGWKITAEIGTKKDDQSSKQADSFTASFDLNKSGKNLLVRARKRGDRFQPLGMKQVKKLQDFMVDSHIPRTWRDRVPLLCSPERILWVVGWRIDNEVKVTQTTKKILTVTFERVPHDCGF